MGNTIRREPVNFSIPASPDYKFLNITNFRGLDVSSNPFELATNTASDCLNVYVDETNTLTTRPRLEKKELKDGSGKDILPLTGRCVGIYPLHDGYLFHWSHEMKILHGDKLTDVLVETMPLTPCKCFEQGNKIYLLGDNRYMVIDENGVLSDVEGYVPNRSIVRLDGTREKDEAINLLNHTYTEKYFWDGVSEREYLSDRNVVSVEDNYYTEYSFPENFVVMVSYEDYTALGYYYNRIIKPSESDNNTWYYDLYYIDFNPAHEHKEQKLNYQLPETVTEKYQTVGMYKCATQSKIIYVSYSKTLTKVIVNEDLSVTTLSAEIGSLITSLYVPPKGSWVGVNSFDGNHYFVSQSTTSSSSLLVTPDSNYYSFVTDNNMYKLSEKSEYEWEVQVATAAPNATYKATGMVFKNKSRESLTGTSNASVLLAQSSQVYITDSVHIATYTNETEYHEEVTDIPRQMILSEDGVGFGITHPNKEPSKMFVVPDYKSPSEWYIIDFESAYFTDKDYSNYNDSLYTTYYYNVFKKKYIIMSNGYGDNIRSKCLIFTNSNEPQLKIYRKLEEQDKEYSDAIDKKQKLLKSTLFTRFDNNYWFASGNTYFRSQNNDPTYFPITEYSELGDSNEDITGFNIANDTTLLAYKPSRLYLIQPFYSEITGMTEYTKTESKNTVGNTAIDAPIVTTLTEIPLQINYDGIYGLSQVSNVSATERIADLMSGSINDRWLNEDDEVIKKAQTLNRLYWTYIILPYTKESKVDSRDVCKVYLLDNRTNSWYYWELPIKLLNAFAKDNRAEFVDAGGNIYYLTTTDIRNMGFDTQLVTEYYDYGKKLIPWYWQSQVLYLGTMNYAKRLVNTTFILTDTDTQDGYGLQYSFKVFRKLASSVPEKELSGELNLVRSTTKKTNLSKFGFLQLKLSNITEESQGTEAEKAYRNNKLRLVGLGLKYVLLEGLIR